MASHSSNRKAERKPSDGKNALEFRSKRLKADAGCPVTDQSDGARDEGEI